MDASSSDLDRLLLFENARKTAELAYAQNPLDAENLTRWGGALLELSSFNEPAEAVRCVTDAESKLEEALEIDPKKHEALWCLGNAYTSHGFYIQDHDIAKGYFAKASKCFQDAINEDSTNELYQKSLELSNKAPDLHLEINKHIASQQASEGSSASRAKAPKKKKNEDLKYDILGWVILVVGVVVWTVGTSKSNASPPTLPPPSWN